ncbi:Gfo/Idh/MocA family protein [Roseobacter sp. GAI101]|uniref:Gfo/Idh/MocA family protein n=1 Tax=Roseobacter sp. (strain GAI101) TaxID=391589 RepID=UPI0001871A4E|nr:Gfo/Idh/MocA family oxidoreductase [Roseobacter sp. GAI101]EEB82502.1 oxidoreductase, NAD-binding [Roseobacter sp. GAI101]
MLRYGLIGAGNVGRVHLRWAARHPNVQVCAVADPELARGKALADNCGARLYADHRQMLADETLDFVSIALPHDLLASIGTECLLAGCHLLVEKPLARHIGEAGQLLEKARNLNLQVGTFFQYRNFATPKLIQSIIESGQIGTIRQIIWTWHELRPQSYFANVPWRKSWAGAGGGLLMNQLSHDIDLLRCFAGEVESVQASLATQAHDIPLEDSVSATIRFKPGAIATISASINQSRALTYRAIMGTKGLIVLPNAMNLADNPDDIVKLGIYADAVDTAICTYSDDHQQSEITWSVLRSKRPEMRRKIPLWLKRPLRRMADVLYPQRNDWKPGRKPMTGHGRILWDFVDAIQAGQPLADSISSENAYRTLELVNAMIVSGFEKREVALPLDAKAYAAHFDRLVRGEIKLNGSSHATD